MIVEELIKTYDGKPVVDSVSFSLPKESDIFDRTKRSRKINGYGNDFQTDCKRWRTCRV